MDNCQRGRYTIAIMMGDAQSDYSEELLRGFFTCAKEEEVNIVFLMGPRIPQYCIDILSSTLEGNYNYQFQTVYDYVSFVGADALIIEYGSVAGFYNIEDEKEFLRRYAKIPYIVLENTAEDAPYLIIDNYVGMSECMKHLVIDHGYRKIAFLSGPKVNQDANERLAVYRKVLQENGIEITDSMIAYGDFSEHVESEICALLDNNPGLEAIVCANDSMAKCCYQVCQSRGLQVGKDIAVTGFDDVESACLMSPPLTSVSQNIYQSGYITLKNAIALCEGKKVESYRMPTSLQRRASCGCSMKEMREHPYVPAEKLEQFVLNTAEKIAEDVLGGISDREQRNHYSSLIAEYFDYIYKMVCKDENKLFEMEYLLDILKQFTSCPHVSMALMIEHFSALLQTLIDNVDSINKQRHLSYIMSMSQKYIYSFDRLKMEKNLDDLYLKAWFTPTFTRYLNQRGKNGDYCDVLIPLMRRLQMMGVKSCYIYLFEDAVVYNQNVDYVLSENMYLTAYYNQENMKCYVNADRPRVTMDNGFASFIPHGSSEILTSFILFSEEKQYGMMLCDVEQEDISFLQICGMQLGSLLRYLEVNMEEQRIHMELKNSLKVIEEKNHVLSFISEYDELTKLLNRRGFMEHAISCCQKNQGKKAYLVFGDLDHLKEINDTFGHSAGDFAIQSAAQRLKSVLPQSAVTARIGGDEFVSLIIADLPGFKDLLIAELKYREEEFNAAIDIPYYVELSVGVYEFWCDAQTELSEIIRKSDELLYEAKKKRRKSIRK